MRTAWPKSEVNVPLKSPTTNGPVSTLTLKRDPRAARREASAKELASHFSDTSVTDTAPTEICAANPPASTSASDTFMPGNDNTVWNLPPLAYRELTPKIELADLENLPLRTRQRLEALAVGLGLDWSATVLDMLEILDSGSNGTYRVDTVGEMVEFYLENYYLG